MRRRSAFALLTLACGVATAADAPPAPTALEIYHKVMPAYSGSDLGGGGCVTVKFEILHNGFVGDVVVLEAKPPALAGVTVDAVKQWHFQSFPKPATPVYGTQTFHFAPEQVRLPDDVVRAPLAVVGAGGVLTSQGCGAKPPPPVTAAPPAQPAGAQRQ